MAQEYSQQRSPGLIDRLNSGVGTFQNARKGLAMGRFLAGHGARAAGSALAGATSATWVPIVIVLILMFFFTLLIVGFTGAPGGTGMPGGNISPTILPPGGGGASITPFPGGSGSNPCTQQYEGNGYCSVGNLKNYFGGNETKSLIASLICQAESGSNPFSLNPRCPDYSVGLFQINLIAHCRGAYDPSDYSACILLDVEKRDACQTKFLIAGENTQYTVSPLSSGGTNWWPWSTWTVASGRNPPVRDILTQCGIQY